MDHAMTGARRFARWGLWLGGALVLLAAVLIGIDVLMRKFLDRSIGGISTDPSGFGIGALLDPEGVRARIQGAVQ